MQNNISNIKIEDCCGCGACYNKCPTGAITMQENNEGFLAPVIDETKCTNCGLCTKACPLLNFQYKNNPKPDCYAAMADDEIRMKSSSGGMFTLLANFILDKGGYVCGAAFDDDWSVHHIIIDNKEDLSKLRGSKYVQSDTENCYKEIKKLLDADKYVLFSGCPCQVAGLYTFLGKEYEKLYTTDLICHGSPSRKVWKKYLTENFDIKNITKIDFRDKTKFGWATTMNIYFKDRAPFHESTAENKYYQAFCPCLILNKHCSQCKYSKLPRQGDISLGDWWGIDNFSKGLNDNKGTSQVLVNSKKGKKIWKGICANLKLDKNIGLNKTLASINKTIYKPFNAHKNRERFFKDIDRFNIQKNIEDCINNHYDICLLTSFFAENYGAILVSYAVNKILKDLGYSVLMLQKPNFIEFTNETNYAMKFGKKHYEISKTYNSVEEMYLLNKYCSTFVVGSDQLFNSRLNFWHCFLEFVSLIKNKIAFGTSFAHDIDLREEKEIIHTKFLLSRFNHIALREKGENLTKIFDLEKAIEIIDPTQMISVEEYNELCKDIFLEEAQEPYLLTYDIDINPQKTDAIKYLANKLNLKIIYIPACYFGERKNTELKPYKEKYTTEEFLYLYKNASFVATDSYHGTLFSIKYNKPFVSFINDLRGSLRYKIFEELNLKDRIVNSPKDVYNNKIILNKIDYTNINKIIKDKSKYAINWLKNALENNTSNKYSMQEVSFDYITKEQSQRISKLEKDLKIVYNAPSIKHKYYRYKILSKILFGKKREHYKQKARIWHEKVRVIRNLTKELSKI